MEYEGFSVLLPNIVSHVTQRSPLKFSALKDHLGPGTCHTVQGSSGPVKVMRLAKDTWTPVAKHHQATEIAFENGERAFLKSNLSRGDFLNERGAYLISRLFGLNVVPDTRLVELGQTVVKTVPVKENKLRQKGEGLYGLYSIQQGVKGHPLHTKTGTQSLNHAIQSNQLDKRSLHALYAYIFIACDPDHEEQNVMLETGTNRLWSIDNTFSGSHYEGFVSFPETLGKKLFEEEALSKEIRADIQAALVNPYKLYQRLTPYYGKKSVSQMIQRAEFLLEYPELVSLRAKFRDFRRASTF